MPRARHRFALLVVAACSGGAVSRPDAGGPDAAVAERFEGGTLALARCGETVTTPYGATAPVLVAAGAAPLGLEPGPKQLHLSLAADPARSIAVVWRTLDETTLATTVRYGLLAATEASEDGVSFRYESGYGSNGPEIRMHEVHLCGLKPDTIYRYQVGGKGNDGREAWSAEHTFRTAPDLVADPSAQITAVAVGDTRGGSTSWGPILQTADRVAAPEVILFTGDAVTLAQLQEEWDSFYDSAEPVLAHVPMVLARGNHESGSTAYVALAALPGNEAWYALDYGPVHLTVLDDSPDDTTSIAGAQRMFLTADLAAHASAPWRLVLHHKSMYSSAANHGSNLDVRAAWGPVVDDGSVDLVLSGHDHDYERTKPMKAGAVAASGGTVYVVTGGAGAALYESGTSDFTVLSESTQNFLVLTAQKGRLTGKAYRGDGTALDTFTLTR